MTPIIRRPASQPVAEKLKMVAKLNKYKIEKHHFLLFLILLLTFLMRLPSLFEPYWYGDEGIFAAVAKGLNLGGVLYRDAWDNKPPMIYLTYAAIFKGFGVSMFSLRLITAIVVLATTTAIYEISQKVLGRKRALVAALIFGFLTSLRIIEGNLALTEIFMILPITLAMMIVILKKFSLPSLFAAGFLFATASLYKQVGAFEAAALGIFLFFYLNNFKKFFVSGVSLTLGFLLPYFLTFVYFQRLGLVSEWVFGAYTYYSIYLSESPQYAILINLLKYLPIVTIVVYCFWLKRKRRKITLNFLFLFWMAFSFLGSYFSGRAYGHYLVQTVPSLSLALAGLNLNLKLNYSREKKIFTAFFFIPFIGITAILFSTVFRWNPIEQVRWWGNFVALASGTKSVEDYNNFYDGNVNTIMGLGDFLANHNASGKSVYIWGDYPWLYAIANLKDPSRYVTSFHVFGVPSGKEEVVNSLRRNPPVYIIKPKGSIGYFPEFEKFLSSNYTFVFKVEDASVYSINN